jgi:thymidylate synthase
MLKIIFAITENNDFCSSDRTNMPWCRIPDDLQFFKSITTGLKSDSNIVIMGKNTFASLAHNPLPDRINIIVSKSMYSQNKTIQNSPKHYHICPSLDEAVQLGRQLRPFGSIFIIGGISIIEEALTNFYISGGIYVTKIGGEIIKYINQEKTIKINYKIPDYLSRVYYGIPHPIETNEYKVKWEYYDRIELADELVTNTFKYQRLLKNENEYLDLMKKLVDKHKNDPEKKLRIDRTNTGTISLFGQSLRLDVSNSFPLLTTKRVFWKGVVEELLWFLSGSSDTKLLEQKGINIWKGNTSRDFLDSKGLDEYREGELGPGYGWQWRTFNKTYITLDTMDLLKEDGFIDKRKGIDQIQEAIDTIKKDPTSRRILVSAWNPSQLNEMALPPCHFSFQFYVDNDKLSILVNMRSSDVFLGLPFNIASYSLLLYMVCHLTNKKPNEVIFMLGDTHIYSNHINQCEEQLKRTPRTPPVLNIKRKVNSINDFKFDDFEIMGYNPYPTIKAEMAV